MVRVIDGVNYFQVDGPFLKTVGLKLLEGKSLYPNPIQGDVIVNESFLKPLMLSEPIGQMIEPADERSKSQVFGSGINGRIVGVVKDFRFQSLRHTVSPTIITIANEPSKWSHITGEILVRVQENSAEAFGTYLQELWKDLKIGGLLTFSFAEDERQKFYAKDISWSKIVSGAALCAVLIASMGALGMISLAVARRRKEIAIRRVMGAVPSKIASGIVLNLRTAWFYSRRYSTTAILFSSWMSGSRCLLTAFNSGLGHFWQQFSQVFYFPC